MSSRVITYNIYHGYFRLSLIISSKRISQTLCFLYFFSNFITSPDYPVVHYLFNFFIVPPLYTNSLWWSYFHCFLRRESLRSTAVVEFSTVKSLLIFLHKKPLSFSITFFKQRHCLFFYLSTTISIFYVCLVKGPSCKQIVRFAWTRVINIGLFNGIFSKTWSFPESFFLFVSLPTQVLFLKLFNYYLNYRTNSVPHLPLPSRLSTSVLSFH